MPGIPSLLIFDLETYSPPLAKHDPKVLEGLTRYAKDEVERADILAKLGLHPVTGEVACVGMFDLARQRPAIFYRRDLGNVDALTPVPWNGSPLEVQLQARDNETALLEAVWGVLEKYESLVTFNGRTFDYPFLMQRSFILGVRVKKHLFANRYQTFKHLDLCDYLSGFGTSRRYSLDLMSRALGIASPKESGLDGAKVSETIDAGNFKAVADYCIRDVIATTQLAQRAFKVFEDDLHDFSSFKA